MDDRDNAVGPRSWLDSLGAAVSIGCAVQCAMFPLLVSVLPFPLLVSVLPYLGPGFLLGGGVEKFFLVTAFTLAVSSFTLGFRVHRSFYLFLFLISAFSLIFIGRVWVENPYQIPFIVSGSLILAAGHIFNGRLCRLSVSCHAPEPKPVSSPAVLNSSSA